MATAAAQHDFYVQGGRLDEEAQVEGEQGPLGFGGISPCAARRRARQAARVAQREAAAETIGRLRNVVRELRSQLQRVVSMQEVAVPPEVADRTLAVGHRLADAAKLKWTVAEFGPEHGNTLEQNAGTGGTGEALQLGQRESSIVEVEGSMCVPLHFDIGSDSEEEDNGDMALAVFEDEPSGEGKEVEKRLVTAGCDFKEQVGTRPAGSAVGAARATASRSAVSSSSGRASWPRSRRQPGHGQPVSSFSGGQVPLKVPVAAMHAAAVCPSGHPMLFHSPDEGFELVCDG